MDRFGLADVGALLFGLAVFVALGYAVTYRMEIAAIGRAVWARYILSSWAGALPNDTDETDDDRALSAGETNNETPETPLLDAETRAEIVAFGETTALARLIAASKIGLTDAVKIGAAAKSGEKYQRRSREIKAAVAQLQQKYRPLTDDQKVLREQLELPPRP